MTPLTVIDPDEVAAAEPAQPKIVLPRRDVRRALDESVRRQWTEHTRRFARGTALLAADTVMGLSGIAIVLNTWWIVSSGGHRPVPDAVPLLAMVFCIQPLALRATGAYGGGPARVSVGRIAVAMMLAATIGWIQARLFGHLTPTLPNKTAYLFVGAVISALVLVERFGFDLAVRTIYRVGLLQRRTLLIAHRDEVEVLQRNVDHTKDADLRVVAAISPRELLDGMDRLDTALTMCDAGGVIIASSLPMDMIGRIMAQCFRNGIAVSLMPRGIQGFDSAFFELHQSSVGLLLQALPMRLGVPQMAVKRAMDMLLTVAGLAVTWPVFVLIALAIKLDSKGPVFFNQTRVGVGGRSFRMMKFRTMGVGADAMKPQLQQLNASGDPRLFKIKNDPRVTRVGHILRKYSLDELPQIFNVLRGEMSLVGPRPFFPGDLGAYEHHHFERLHVLPGITGLWQVSGRSDVVDFEEVVRLDREYIKNWSVAADLAILVRTIPAALGRGAY